MCILEFNLFQWKWNYKADSAVVISLCLGLRLSELHSNYLINELRTRQNRYQLGSCSNHWQGSGHSAYLSSKCRLLRFTGSKTKGWLSLQACPIRSIQPLMPGQRPEETLKPPQINSQSDRPHWIRLPVQSCHILVAQLLGKIQSFSDMPRRQRMLLISSLII